MSAPKPEAAPIEQQGLGWKNSKGIRQRRATPSRVVSKGAWTSPRPTQWSHDYFTFLFKYEWELIKGPGRRQPVAPPRTRSECRPRARCPRSVGKTHRPMMLTTDLVAEASIPIYAPDLEAFPTRTRKSLRAGCVREVPGTSSRTVTWARSRRPARRLRWPKAQLWQDPGARRRPQARWTIRTSARRRSSSAILDSGLDDPAARVARPGPRPRPTAARDQVVVAPTVRASVLRRRRTGPSTQPEPAGPRFSRRSRASAANFNDSQGECQADLAGRLDRARRVPRRWKPQPKKGWP